MTRLLIPVILASLALAACGEDGGTTTVEKTTTETVEATTTPEDPIASLSADEIEEIAPGAAALSSAEQVAIGQRITELMDAGELSSNRGDELLRLMIQNERAAERTRDGLGD